MIFTSRDASMKFNLPQSIGDLCYESHASFGGHLQLPAQTARQRVQRIDGNYLYVTGHQIRPLNNLSDNATYAQALFPLLVAEQALDTFLHLSVFKLRYSLTNGETLISWVRWVKDKALKSSDFANEVVDPSDIQNLKNALSNFETTLASEFGQMPIYLVAKKGGYDTYDLIENGKALFQATLESKVPEAIRDIEQATRCIAFEVPTAAGFHLHRANESVLHKYFDAVRGNVSHPDGRNMGAYLAVMEAKKLGDERVRAALKDIKNLHRNPLIHPEHTLESVDEAIDLLGAIRAAVGAMLPAIAEAKSAEAGAGSAAAAWEAPANDPSGVSVSAKGGE